MAKWSGGAEHTRTGIDLRRARSWDAQATREVGTLAQALVSRRAFDEGRGSDDRPHKPYSTTPLWVSDSAFPRPRGGRKTDAGVYYAGGYAERKRALGPKRPGQVDLTLTGRMRRSFRVKRASKYRLSIGLVGRPAVYGTFVNRRRPWMALSPKDREAIQSRLGRIIAGALRRTGGVPP